MENQILSKRAEVARDWEDFFNKYIYLCLNDAYDEKKNPKGYVSLGTAVNNMCLDIIEPRLNSADIWFCDPNLLQYRQSYGTKRLREVFAKIITEFFESPEPISPDNLFFVNGVTSCIELIVHCLADPGEVFLVPTPMYGRILTNFKQRALVDMWPIPIIDANEKEDFPALTLDKIISGYENALASNCVVRGIFLINPHNPLGDIYSPKLLMDIMSFCKAHSIHLVVDEVYALSVFSNNPKFHSILKFSDIPDPERTHVLYGLSKDFGMAGMRVGAIHTKCEQLQKCLIQLSFFHTIPYPVMEITARFLEDLDWCRNYISTNQQRLSEKFNFCVDYLKKIGVKVRGTNAGFFLWVDLRHICGSSFEDERDFFLYLIEKARLYICPGKEFLCAQPGWFRMVFTQSPHHLQEGLSRFERALKEYKPPEKNGKERKQ